MPLLLQGDCLKQMQNLDDNSVDSIVTDPPYGIKFMAKKWDHNVPNVEIWQEALRVLKPGGHLLCACGTRTQHRMVVNIEDAGFEIRDVVTWMYGSGFPKSLNIGKSIDKKLGNKRTSLGTKIKKAGDMRSGNYDKGGDYDDMDDEDYPMEENERLPIRRKKLAKAPKADKLASKQKMKLPSGLVSYMDFAEMIKEKLTKKHKIGDYVEDFEKSDAKQFKGKSDKKKKQMAVAAYLSKQND